MWLVVGSGLVTVVVCVKMMSSELRVVAGVDDEGL